jgi:hypothetical protein
MFAKLTGDAMLGEEIGTMEHLDRLLAVEPTTEPAAMNSWNADLSWQGPIKMLRLEDEGATFLYSPSGERVGFSLPEILE